MAACAATACNHDCRVSPNPHSFPHPSGWTEERRQKRIRAGTCLRRSRVFVPDPAFDEHRRLPRSAAQGTQTIGSPFFSLGFFGEAKKSKSPAGASPGLLANHKSRSNADSWQTWIPDQVRDDKPQKTFAINSIAVCDRSIRAAALNYLEKYVFRRHRRQAPIAHGIPAAAKPGRR